MFIQQRRVKQDIAEHLHDTVLRNIVLHLTCYDSCSTQCFLYLQILIRYVSWIFLFEMTAPFFSLSTKVGMKVLNTMALIKQN